MTLYLLDEDMFAFIEILMSNTDKIIYEAQKLCPERPF